MTVEVYNRSQDPIIIRYVPNGQHTVNSNQSVQLNVQPGTELFALKQRDEHTPFARIVVNPDTLVLHFTENGAEYGAGSPVQSTTDPTEASFLSFLQPSPGRGALLNPEPVEAVFDAPPQATPEVSSTSQLVYIPGMGYMNKDHVPPQVLDKLSQPQQQPPRLPPPVQLQYKQEASTIPSWIWPTLLIVVILCVIWFILRKKVKLF